MQFPKNLSMSIDHNNHKNFYQNIETYFSNYDFFKDCISQEDLKICIEKDELWELQWYPNTPISFYKVISYSLERCLELANEIESKG